MHSLDLNHLSRRARRAGTSTLLASFAAFTLLGGLTPGVSAQAAPLSVSIDDVAVTEGVDASAVFTVSVSGNHPNSGITVDYETRDGTAVAGLDYTATSGTLSIPAGAASGSVSVPLIDDATHEPAETFKVKLLSSSVAIAVNGDLGTATITSNDPMPRLTIRNAQVTEGDGPLFTNTMAFNVELDRPSNADVTVDYTTVDGTAVGKPTVFGSHDYVSKTGTLTFPANTNATQQILVAVKGDSVYEGDEEFYVQLSNNFNATIARGKATGTIVDNEVKPHVAITGNFSAPEGNTTYTEYVTVNLSGLTDQDVSFKYSTFDGTAPAAHAPSDYTAVSNGTGTIPAGSLSTLVPVVINGDKNVESDENFFVTISDPTNAGLGSATCQITLRNDD